MAGTGNRAKQFSVWENTPVQDHDPEAEAPSVVDESASSDESDDEQAGTEHYIHVEKSRLRRNDLAILGPQYRGARVSRDALDESWLALEERNSGDGEEDHEDSAASSRYEDVRPQFHGTEKAALTSLEAGHGRNADLNGGCASDMSDDGMLDHLSSRGSSTSAEGERAKKSIAADFLDDEAELEGDDMSGDDSEEDEGETGSDLDGFIHDGSSESEQKEGSDGSEVESESSDGSGDDMPSPTADRGFSEAFKAGERSVADSLVESRQKDIAKGKAVRQQRQAFDAALNVRIRLQKALVAINTLGAVDGGDEDVSEAYEAAEAAAVKLWNTIDDFRDCNPERSGLKRKRDVEPHTSSQDIWAHMLDMERRAVQRRKSVLEKWSGKTKKLSSESAAQRERSRKEETLTTLLEQQLLDPERLVRRTQNPRSCAPAQMAKKIEADADIYDDGDFYHVLLRELVDQRTADTSATGGQTAMVHYAAVRETRTKKHAGTKASKGRKMRFGVHEKLQNFMAPEDRRSWEQHAIDRFFGDLFGQKAALDEDGGSGPEMTDYDAEEEGLRLFRS